MSISTHMEKNSQAASLVAARSHFLRQPVCVSFRACQPQQRCVYIRSNFQPSYAFMCILQQSSGWRYCTRIVTLTSKQSMDPFQAHSLCVCVCLTVLQVSSLFFCSTSQSLYYANILLSFRKSEDSAAFLKLSGPEHIFSPVFCFWFFFFCKTLHEVGNILWVLVFHIPFNP